MAAVTPLLPLPNPFKLPPEVSAVPPTDHDVCMATMWSGTVKRARLEHGAAVIDDATVRNAVVHEAGIINSYLSADGGAAPVVAAHAAPQQDQTLLEVLQQLKQLEQGQQLQQAQLQDLLEIRRTQQAQQQDLLEIRRMQQAQHQELQEIRVTQQQYQLQIITVSQNTRSRAANRANSRSAETVLQTVRLLKKEMPGSPPQYTAWVVPPPQHGYQVHHVIPPDHVKLVSNMCPLPGRGRVSTGNITQNF